MTQTPFFHIALGKFCGTLANPDLTEVSQDSPTEVSVTFAIKDTHKTLQPPDPVSRASLRVLPEDSTLPS